MHGNVIVYSAVLSILIIFKPMIKKLKKMVSY